MHFYAQKYFPGLYQGRNGRLQKKTFYICRQKRGYTPGVCMPGGCTPGITVVQNTDVGYTEIVIISGK